MLKQIFLLLFSRNVENSYKEAGLRPRDHAIPNIGCGYPIETKSSAFSSKTSDSEK